MGGTPTELIATIYEAINRRDLDAVDTLFAKDFVDHGEGDHDREQLKQQLATFYAGFSDLHVQVEEMVVEGDRYACRTTVTGTNDGALMGMPPTGRSIRVTAVDIGRLEGGQARERWGGLDTYALLTQLGVIPAPQPA